MTGTSRCDNIRVLWRRSLTLWMACNKVLKPIHVLKLKLCSEQSWSKLSTAKSNVQLLEIFLVSFYTLFFVMLRCYDFASTDNTKCTLDWRYQIVLTHYVVTALEFRSVTRKYIRSITMLVSFCCFLDLGIPLATAKSLSKHSIDQPKDFVRAWKVYKKEKKRTKR